jgi:FAD/FMN-containing dehydrogenase
MRQLHYSLHITILQAATHQPDRGITMNRRQFFRNSIATAVAASLSSSVTYASWLQSLTEVSSAVNAVTGSGTQTTLEQAAVQELGDSLRGRLLLAGSEGYDQARRVMNASINKYPALIVQPTGAADVRNAVTFARERNLLLAVKCGGHSFPGKSTCDGGMMIDLSSLRSARVNAASKTAYIAGGSLLGELDHEAMSQGLVTTAGTVSHTGVGGLTLGGGFGRVARRFGLALDNVKAVDIVTADGQLRHASADENPDLYWAVRGGGGNFGVVTAFEFGLHPMQRQVIGGDVIFPLARARDVLKFYADFSMSAPEELYADLIMNSPPGSPDGVVLIHVCYSGDAGKAEQVLAPLKKLGTPIADTIKPIDYVAIQRSGDNTDPRAQGEYLKSGFLSDIPDRLIDDIVDGFEPDPVRGTIIFFQHAGGAIGRVAADATAFPHRYAENSVFAAVTWPLEAGPDAAVSYLRKYWATLEPHTYGYYTNESADESHEVRDANYQGNFARLVQIKNQYDPTNLFRLNANIRPSV